MPTAPPHAGLTPDPAGHRSPRLTALGVPHVFGTRRHPVQTPGDARALADAAGLPPGPVYLSTQCHGRGVTGPGHRPADARADAHVTDRRGDLVAVRTADCVPVLLAGAQGRCVAAVHAGWRGLVAGVIEAAAQTMRQRGGPPVAAAVGPCIGAGAYEIGPEVAAQFPPAFLEHPSHAPRPRLDLRRAAAARLLELGLAAADIDVSMACTHRDEDLFFSYRRGTERGHQATLICPAPA